MRVGCVICGDLFVPADEISATPCGHTFHTECVRQWITRSKSCPSCRHKAPEKSLTKLFFDTVGEDTYEHDPDQLQIQIDNMKFQIRLKDTELNNLKETDAKITKQNKGLVEELKAAEKQVRNKETTNIALKAQLKYMTNFKTEADKSKETVKNLRSQLDVLQNVEMIVAGTNQDVESMLSSYGNDPENIRSLATFCSILKKELNKTVEDKKRFREEASSLRMKYKELKSSCRGSDDELSKKEQMIELLRSDIMSLETENKSLKKKLDILQQSISSPSGNVKNSALHRLIAESPAPAELKRPHCSSSEDEFVTLTPEVVRKMARTEAAPANDVILLNESPEIIDLCRQNDSKNIILPGRRPLAVTTNISRVKQHHDIFSKNIPSTTKFGSSQSSSSLTSSSTSQMGYDGFGGHHKVDEFPKPKVLYVKKKSGVKVVTKGGANNTTQKTTLKNFFQNTFGDEL